MCKSHFIVSQAVYFSAGSGPAPCVVLQIPGCFSRFWPRPLLCMCGKLRHGVPACVVGYLGLSCLWMAVLPYVHFGAARGPLGVEPPLQLAGLHTGLHGPSERRSPSGPARRLAPSPPSPPPPDLPPWRRLIGMPGPLSDTKKTGSR